MELLLVPLEAAGGQRRDGVARGGQRDGADDVRRAGLVSGRRVGAQDVSVHRGAANRAAAGEVRRRGVEPVPPTDEHPRAVRRVELVAGEGEVVDADRGDVDPTVRDELRPVDRDAGAVAVRDLGQLGQRAAPRR